MSARSPRLQEGLVSAPSLPTHAIALAPAAPVRLSEVDGGDVDDAPGHERQGAIGLRGRTRAQMAGCAHGAEALLRIRLSAHLPDGLVDAVPQGILWHQVRGSPDLLSASFQRHCAMRAIFGAIGGDAKRAASIEGFPADLVDEIIGLSLALTRWGEVCDEDRPMRIDLCAEATQELLWLGAGIMTRAIAPMDVVADTLLMPLIDQVTSEECGRYDEASAPLAQAARLAQRLCAADGRAPVGKLIDAQQHFLAVAVLAHRCDLDLSVCAEGLIDASGDALLVAMATQAGVDVGHIVPLVQAVAASCGRQACLVSMTAEEARNYLARVRISRQFASALDRLDRQAAL